MEKGFTLVIALYNKIETIKNTLNSVLYRHGSYPFKCLIIDDDSTDGSSDIALEFDRKYPDVFQYIKRTHHEKKTPSYARNMGIMLADTEYIGFLNADDEICPGFIDRGCNFLDEHPEYSMYGCGQVTKIMNEKKEVCYYHFQFHEDIRNFEDYVVKNGLNISFCANIYKTELARKNLFLPVFTEDMVFKIGYIFKNPNIYIDKEISESFIWDLTGDNHSAYNAPLKPNDKPGLEIVFDMLNENIPGFNYTVRVINDNDFWLSKKP